jgi:SlyX protein
VSRSAMVCNNLACKNSACPNEIRTRHVTNESKTLGERIDTLETRLAYQDDAIETLNQTITAQWKQIDALTRRIAELGERLQEAEANAPGAANERPPHY